MRTGSATARTTGRRTWLFCAAWLSIWPRWSPQKRRSRVSSSAPDGITPTWSPSSPKPQKAKCDSPERAIVCALRRATGFPLDDLTFVVPPFLPPLNRDAFYRILKAEGLGRLPPADRSRRSHSRFKEYDLGFVHVDVKHLPKLRTQDGQSRKRYLYVAIDRASRFVHLAVKDDETERSAVAFLKEAVQASPFKVTHVLPSRGSCFTADGFERACEALGRGASQDTALHASHERHGGALQWAGAARGAGHHGCQPP